jgi:hypothetical protein
MSKGSSGTSVRCAPDASPACSAIQPAHHLDQQHPLVGLRSGVQPVDHLGRDADRGVEAEGQVGAVDVVVDGLGDADDRHTLTGQHRRRRQRPLTADRH